MVVEGTGTVLSTKQIRWSPAPIDERGALRPLPTWSLAPIDKFGALRPFNIQTFISFVLLSNS